MNIQFFVAYYEPYLAAFYAARPGLEEASFEAQHRALCDDFFGTYNSYYRHLKKRYPETGLYIANNEVMQKKWAEENGVEYADDNWQKDIVLAQVKKTQPDIFYITSMFGYYDNFLDEVKKHARILVAEIACPIPEGISMDAFSMVFSAHPRFVEEFRQQGLRSEFLRFGFDPDINDILPPGDGSIPVSFLGTIGWNFQKRIDALRIMVEKTPIQIWSPSVQLLRYANRFWNFGMKRVNRKIPKAHMGEAWGLDKYRVFRNSRITFNSHIDVSGAHIGNIRMYEATGVGTLLLTDGFDAPNRIFEHEKEVIYYKDAHDAADKARYFLKHDAERKEIAANGQRRTLTEFNINNVLDTMLQYLEALMSKQPNTSYNSP